MRLSDQNLRGRTIIAADGRAVGEITQIFLDPGATRVEAFQVKLRREMADRLGASHGVFRPGFLEVPVRLLQSVGDAVVLSVPTDELKQVLPPPDGQAPAAH